MASRSLNKVVLLGNLTRDPELKHTPAGTAVCTFGIATNRSWTTADGNTKEEAQYHRVVAWQKLAELCEKLLAKGQKVYLEGRITYRDFTTKEGQPKSITEIVLDDFILLQQKEKKVSSNPPVKNNDQANQGSDGEYAINDDTSYDYNEATAEQDSANKKNHSDVNIDDINL